MDNGRKNLRSCRFCRSCGKIFKGRPIEKGIAFPTCLSLNKYALSQNIDAGTLSLCAKALLCLQLRRAFFTVARGTVDPSKWRLVKDVRLCRLSHCFCNSTYKHADPLHLVFSKMAPQYIACTECGINNIKQIPAL